jgi:hypothetical protein
MSEIPISADEPQVVRPPEHLARLVVSASVVANTLQGLALGRDREMLAYWIGRALPDGPGQQKQGIVTTVAFPRIISGYNYFRLVEGEMSRILDWCSRRELWILAQIHSHPTYEPHSEADEAGPISHRPGFMSVIVPFFAQFSTVREPLWGAYEHLGGGAWVAIDPNTRFEVLNDVWISGFE